MRAGKSGVLVTVLLITSALAIAIAKPWGTSSPPSPPTPPVIYATYPPTQAPGATAQAAIPSVPVVAVDPIRAIDWNAMGRVLAPKDAWGIRAIVYRSDNTVREQWTALRGADTDYRSAFGVDASALLGFDGTVAALGLTTPLGQLPLDVRAWYIDGRAGGSRAIAQHLPIASLTPEGDPTQRLLAIAPAWSANGSWPQGDYELDALTESGVVRVYVWVSGAKAKFPTPSKPLNAPADRDLRDLAQSPGAFLISGEGGETYRFFGIAEAGERHDTAESSWLGVGNDRVFRLPGLVQFAPSVKGTASLIGAALLPGEQFVMARLSEVVPFDRVIGSGRPLSVPASAAHIEQRVVVFEPLDAAAGFEPGIYRIDATVRQGEIALQRSWDVPLMDRPSSTTSPVLGGLHLWSTVSTAHWSVLVPGSQQAVDPLQDSPQPADPGDSCQGGTDVGVSPQFIGVTFGNGPADRIQVNELDGSSAGAGVAVQVSRLVPGLAVLRPIGADWRPGNYALVFSHAFEVVPSRTVVICVH